MGPTNLVKARSERVDSIRSVFALDGTRNAVHGSDSETSAVRELSFFFNVGGSRVVNAVVRESLSDVDSIALAASSQRTGATTTTTTTITSTTITITTIKATTTRITATTITATTITITTTIVI